MRRQCKAMPAGRGGAVASAMGAAVRAAVFGVFVCGAASAVAAPVEVLKTMPAQGSVRQGDVVYVDDGRCPAGQVKKIIGGNQKTGVARQVECVKRPQGDSAGSGS